MSKVSRTRASSHDSAKSRGRTNDLRDFKTTRYDQLIRDFEPCAATSSMFLYAQGPTIICCRHQTLEIERRFTRHSEAIQLLAVDNISQRGAGRLVVSYDAGQTAIVWDLKTGEEIARFASYSHLTTATWMKNGNIAFGNMEGHVIQFEPATSEHSSTRTLSQIPITALAVANDSATFAIGYQNGTLLVAALGDRFNVLHTLATNRAPSPIVTLQWHSSTPQQKSIMLAAQTRDGDLRVWSVPKATHGGIPTAVRILSKNEQNFVPGPNWMSWSKNGRIIQYSDKETLSWDVRTRHVTRDPIPTGSDIRGIAIHGTGATLFTLGTGGRVQQFNLNSPSVLVADVQHSSHLLPPSPPFSIEEAVKASASSTLESENISINGEYAGSEKNLDIHASQKGFTRQDYSDMELTNSESARVDLSVINDGSSLPTENGHRKMGTSENTYISTGSYLNTLPYTQKQATRHYKQQSTSDFRSQSSLNTKSTFPRPPADRSRSKSRSGFTKESEPQTNLDIFKYTRTRLDDIPYRPSIRGGAPLTNDDLRRQMLNTVFGWNGEVEELILDEMARHPRGSSIRIILSKWIGKEPDEEEIMASADLMSSSDWMLLALSGVGTQPSQKKLGRTYITKLLEQRELHAAVTIMLGMGDHFDAIEVYHSHKRYMEALILTCLYLPSVWERQSAILKKWGEWAVQHGQQQLAIRCFACTEHEPTEPWTSPSAMQLSFQSLDHSVFSPPLSPPSTIQRTAPRQTAKTSALKLITNFGEPSERKRFFSEESFSARTPAPNSIKDADMDYDCNGEDPTTAVHHPSDRSAFVTPTATSMQSNPSINNGNSRKRLPSIGESSAESRRLNAVNRHVVQAQDSPEVNNQPGLSNAMNLTRVATASPMMVRTDYPRLAHEQVLLSPRAVLSQKMETMDIRNTSRDKINRMNLNIDTTMAMNLPDNQSGSAYSRYRWPRRRGPGSICSINSSSASRSIAKPTNKPTRDGYTSSLDFTIDRQQANRQDEDDRERSQGLSLERGRSTSRNYPAKRSPRSPVPMSPEDIVSLKASSITSANMATPATPTGKIDERLQTWGYSSRQYSRTRWGSTDEKNIPLTPSAVHIPAQLWTTSREIKPSTSSTPMSLSLKPSLAGSEDEGDYQLALADRERFRRTRSASRGRSASRTRVHKDGDLLAPSVTEKVKGKPLEPQDKEVPSQLEFHGHAGDLRIIKEERQRKREMAAKELEQRRKELVDNTNTNAIPHPQSLSIGEFISRPRTANEVITVFRRDIPRSLTAEPYSMPNPSQNLNAGISISPKTMGLTQDPSQVGDHPPTTTQPSTQPLQPPKEKPKGMLSLAPSRNIRVTPGLATSGLPLPSHTQESLAFLPSTVYQPPSKGIPRSQSAPIPDEPSFLHFRDNYRQHERTRKNSHSSRQDNGRSNPPPVLKELQHLVSSNPTTKDGAGLSEAMLSPPLPPPPPPPPIGHIPTAASALATGMIEIVKDDNPLPRIQHKASHSVGRNTPVIVSQSELMVPILSAPAPPMRGQTRGRSSTDSNIAERLNKATEHLRSSSRTRKENAKRDIPRSPQDGPGSVSNDNTAAQAQHVRPAPSQRQSQDLPLIADLESLPTGMEKNEFF